MAENEFQQLRAEINKQAREQVARWTLITLVTLVSLALAGWWLALKPWIIEELGGVPSGAILALADARYSDLNKVDAVTEGCPPGWTRFKEGEGRFVIGADSRSQNDGSGDYWVLRQAGSSTATLEERHLPSHKHSIQIGKNQTMKFVNPNEFDEAAQNSPLVSNGGKRHPYSSGGEYISEPNLAHASEPLNTLPPYVALYLCKKT